MSSVHDELRFDRLVDRTYAAAFDTKIWQELGPDLAACFGGHSAVIRRVMADPTQGVILATENLTVAAAQTDLARHWFEHDLWAARAARFGLGRVVRTQELIDDASLERTGFYQDWLRPLDIHKCLGCVLDLADWGQLVVGIHRPREVSAYGEADARLFSAWLPHLKRALGQQTLFQHDSQQRWTQAQMLEACVDALFVLDADARLLNANPQGEAVLRQGTTLRCHNGRVVAQAQDAQRRLLRTLDALGHGQARAARLLNLCDATGGGLAVASLTPLPERMQTQPDMRRLILLRLREARCQTIAPSHLIDLFGLTSTEARVVASLSQGQGVEQIALAQQVQANTVLAHLKRAMVKTGTHRQAELVALVCRACLAL
jgi:DNA-binding CsgD family transcriptional regulator